MSDPAGYTFYPWVRRGASAFAQSAASSNYLNASLSLDVNGTAVGPVGVRLYGPAQVRSIDSRAIVRMEPAPNTATFEPNYFAAIEFANADMPWLFSPAVPAGATLRPWLCLVVVRAQPGVALVPRSGMLPLLQFEAPAVPLNELPNLDQIAMWAHAQSATGASVDSAISRIVCPRQLQPATSYIACLVPACQAGVSAGTSPDIAVDDSDVAPAWDTQRYRAVRAAAVRIVVVCDE